MSERHRYAVVECATMSQSYDPHDYLCCFDLPQEWSYQGTIRECLLFISRTDTPTDYLIVHLRRDDTYTFDDIVWRPYDYECEEWLSFYLRKTHTPTIRIMKDTVTNTAHAL